MTTKLYSYVAAIALIFTICSCTQELTLPTEKGTLTISTRSDNEASLYPLSIYIFNESGTCVKKITAVSDSEELSAELPTGSYSVKAFSQANEKVWSIPSQSEASANPTIGILANASPTELAFGSADINLQSGGASCAITLTRLIAGINVNLTNVPADASAVRVKASSLYTGFDTDGAAQGSGGNQEFALSQTNGTQEWTASNVLIMPGCNSQMTLAITVTRNGTDTTYMVTATAPKSNQQLTFNGKYLETGEGTLDANQKLSFQISLTRWNMLENNQEFGSVTTNSKPELGKVWKEAVVMGFSNQTSDGMDVLLMSLYEWTNIKLEDAPSKIAAYQTSEITAWELPTSADVALMSATRNAVGVSTLNSTLENAGSSAISSNAYFLCREADGTYNKYRFSGNISDLGTTTQFRFRAVASVHYSYE